MNVWNATYKPSLNTGCYGSFLYAEEVPFYPQTFSECIPEKNSQYYIINKFQQTLDHIPFDINVWYPYVQKYTFDTKFIDISPSTAESLMNFYRDRYISNKVDDRKHMSLLDCANIRALNNQLSEEISKCIQKWYSSSNTNNNNSQQQKNGVFIRFSNRSPKDGHKIYQISTQEFEQKMNTYLKYLCNKYPNDYQPFESMESVDANTKMVAFCKSSSLDLFVDNARDAMSLILSSERIFSDMLSVTNAHKYPYKYLHAQHFTSSFVMKMRKKNIESEEKKEDDEEDGSCETFWDICDIQIAIRKWDSRIKDELEFRCFVFDNELRAISQYNHYCYFAHFANYPQYIQQIKRSIVYYWKTYLQKCIPVTQYVIDIAIVADDECSESKTDGLLDCIVIELNPFAVTTGACLFHWKIDGEQLKYGTEVEIRIHQKSIISDQFVRHYINEFNEYAVEKPWDELLDEMEQKLMLSEKKISTDDRKNKCIVM